MNSIEIIKELEFLYLSFVVVEKENESIGLEFLNKWIERELAIFKNILDISSNSSERIMLIIGSDQVWLLRKLFEGKGWKVLPLFSEQ